MSVRCDGCHRRTAPGERFCTDCRKTAENRTLSDFHEQEDSDQT